MEDVSVFLNAESHHGSDALWFTQPLGTNRNQLRRNYFTDLKAIIGQTAGLLTYSYPDPMKWEKHYTNHSIRVQSCNSMQRAGISSHIIGRKLDHKSEQTQLRYVDKDFANLQAVLALQSMYRPEVVTPKPPRAPVCDIQPAPQDSPVTSSEKAADSPSRTGNGKGTWDMVKKDPWSNKRCLVNQEKEFDHMKGRYEKAIQHADVLQKQVNTS